MTNSILSALVNGTLVSAPLAIAVMLGMWATPRHVLNSASRYAVWWAALLVTVLLPLAYLRLPQSAPSRPAAVLSPNSSPATSSVPPATDARPLSFHRVDPPAIPRFPVVLAARPWLRWIPIAWAMLSALMLLRLAASCILLRRRKRAATALPQSTITNRRVRVMASTEIRTPVLAGLSSPAILIPARLVAAMDDEDLLRIVLHEATHATRRDDYALFAQRILEALFPFHPVVRCIARQIGLEREIACDDVVVALKGSPRKYAACLARTVELCGGIGASLAGIGVIADRSQLAKRVDRLLDRQRATESRHPIAGLAAAISMVAALAAIAIHMPGAIALASPRVPPADPPALAAPTDPQTPETTEQTQTPVPPRAPELLQLAVTVHDASNRFIAGLSKENFRIYEDGVPQEVADFSVAPIPHSLGIVLDTSGSMRDKQALVNLAAMQLAKSASPIDDIFLVTVNNDVQVIAGFGGYPDLLQNQLNQTIPRGGTALRDGISQALQWKNGRYNQRMLVVISDGDDNSSSLTADELRATVEAAKVPIFFITLRSPDAPDRQKWRSQIGNEFVTEDPSQVAEIAASLAVETQYVLKYQSKNTAQDGAYRKIKVELIGQPDGLVVRTRSGYYANGK